MSKFDFKELEKFEGFLAVDYKTRHILIQKGVKFVVLLASRNRNKLIQKASLLDNFGYESHARYYLRCFGYSGSHIIWVRISDDQNGQAQVYDYDRTSLRLKRLPDKRVNFGKDYPLRVFRRGNEFFYASSKNRLYRLRLETRDGKLLKTL